MSHKDYEKAYLNGTLPTVVTTGDSKRIEQDREDVYHSDKK